MPFLVASYETDGSSCQNLSQHRFLLCLEPLLHTFNVVLTTLKKHCVLAPTDAAPYDARMGICEAHMFCLIAKYPSR